MMDNNVIERWTMYRAVFYNFWYYPNQELIFKDGCAVLRGHNASGKSVTTQSLITVLLDGDVRSHKLDPFGGRERKITDTVLGEKELLDLKHRIGYIALEFKKGNTGVTKTIGIGIEAIRDNKKTKIWYFIINGKRIGEKERNLKLYTKENVDGEMKSVPLDEKDLRIQIEQELQCGKVYSDRDEYASAVNKQLFGFENLESYKGLIDLLLQARSPRLSDTKRPEAAAEVLNDSLPSLTEDEIRPLTSSIEAIDRLEKDLMDYKRDLKAIRSLNDVYQEYNEIAFAEKADVFLKSYKQYEATKGKITDSKKLVTKFSRELESVYSELKKADIDLEAYKIEKADLKVEEIDDIQNRKANEENKLKGLRNRLESLESKRDSAKRLYIKHREQYEIYELQKENKEKELYKLTEEIKYLGSEMNYEEHQNFAEHFSNKRAVEGYSFDVWEKSLRDYKKMINDTKNMLEKSNNLLRHRTDKENSIGNLRMRVDEVQGIIDHQENDYEDTIYNLRNEIALWVNQSRHISVTENIKEMLLNKLEDVYDTIEKDEYFKLLNQHVHETKSSMQAKIMRLEIEIEKKVQDSENILNAIEEWRNKIEVEPAFVFTKKEEWSKLVDENIMFIPFYEAFEFKEGLNDEEKIQLQNALFESGVLSSVVVDKQQVEQGSKYTTVLKYHEEKSKNLTDVLVPADNPSFNELLLGIAYEVGENGYVISDGVFDTTFVKGKASLFDSNVFIGKSSREKYRKKMILELEEQYVNVEIEREKLVNKKQTKTDYILSVEMENKRFPEIGALKELLGTITSQKQMLSDYYFPEIEKLTVEVQDLNNEIKTVLLEVKRRMSSNNIQLTVDSFVEELNKIEEYAECLQDIKNNYKDKNHAYRHAINYLEQAEREKDAESDFYSDMVDAENEIKKTTMIISGLAQRLKDMGQEDILKRLEELSILINEMIPRKRDELIRKDGELKNNIKQEENKLIQIEQQQLPFEKVVFEAWENTFSYNLKLNFIPIDDELTTNIDKARYVSEKYGHLLDKNRTNLDRIKKRLSDRYQKQNMELPRYELELDTRHSEYFPQYETEDEIELSQLNLIKEQMSRIVIMMNVDENKVTPFNAVERLTKRIEDLEIDANEKDRELYQDILINTLGDKIRRKIQYVEGWQKEMNKFMEHENIIKFRIKWVPKKTEQEGELDTSKLVEALKKDSRWIDIDEISNHFRSKIKEAKRRYNDEADANLQKIMKEVLDYRNWFEFEIYFTKKGGNERRLNRNTYGELSGGQRVLAMVTPVLAALYAKYLEGREDAPKIFTLDEAFARVDDDNINIMFEYIYKLGFNYILNSQSLWGCFGSVPSLNIYELSRPDNRPFVAIQSYYWNGNKRDRIDEKWFEKEKEGLEHVTTS